MPAGLDEHAHHALDAVDNEVAPKLGALFSQLHQLGSACILGVLRARQLCQLAGMEADSLC